MRNALTVLATLMWVTLTASAADEKYKSKEGKFAIQFPAGVEVKTDAQKVGNTETLIATAEDGDKTYHVAYLDLTEKAKNRTAKEILDASQNGGVNESGGKLERSKNITLGKDKWPGREVVVDVEGDKIKSRFYLIDTKLYVIAVSGKKDFALGKDAAKFLDSFEIMK